MRHVLNLKILMKKIDNSARYLLDNGLIFEINRKVLHPLGLALIVDIDPDNSRWVTIKGLVSVEDDDEEGFVFDDETFKDGSRKYELFLLKEGQKKLNAREKKLGFIIQTEKESNKDEIV